MRVKYFDLKEADFPIVKEIYDYYVLNRIKLFEKCGFEKCGHYKEVGEKFDKILDVVSYEKLLGRS